ncbi:MAG: hypothetical protein AB1847_19510 [bacterium]
MRNQYKRLDVFRCRHESHQGFGNVVSAYHVLKEKGCYPHGCIYFKWKCHKLDRGISCPKTYTHVGRKCISCPEYFDEKIIKCPEVLLGPEDYEHFLKNFRDFEMWLYGKRDKQVDFTGEIKAVKPRFIMSCHNGHSRVSFQGFLVVFEKGFVDLTSFEDTIYAILSPSQQTRFRLGEGDQLDLRAILRIDRGRLVLDHVRAIEVERKVSAKSWTLAEARQVLLTSRILDTQCEKCLNCPHSSLVDVQRSDALPEGQKKRKLLCLKGMSTPEYCIIQAKEKLHQIDHCQNERAF